MKKIIIFCLVAVMLLAGCDNRTPDSNDETLYVPDKQTESESEEQTTPESDEQTPPEDDEQTPPESDVTTAQGFGYTEADLDSLILADLRRGISVDVSANRVLKAGLMDLKYNSDAKKTDVGEAVYELKINGRSLYIYPENVASYNGSEAYSCLGFDALAYLDGACAGEVTQLNGFADDVTVKVQKAQGLLVRVNDKPDFFTKLDKVKIIKVANASDYVVPSMEYTVTIGENSIKICGDYLSIGEELYAVVEGDFSFLTKYAFSSSPDGFLPPL